MPEDLAFGLFLKSINASLPAMTNPFLFGSWFQRGWDQVLTGNLSLIERCPDTVEDNPDSCRRFLAPLRDVVIFHANYGLHLAQNRKNVATMFGADPTIYWWMPRDEAVACKIDRDMADRRGFGSEIALMRKMVRQK
jgi:hypothetical protein